MTTQSIIDLFDKYVISNYTRIPIVFVRGEGSHLWDADGRRYLDLFPGWGVDGLGHCPPRVTAALQAQAGKLLHVANNYYMEPQGKLAKIIAERSFGGKCFFCNSGAEANEAAIKLARLATPPDRYKIITFKNSFHGRSFATISATAQPKYHEGFKPIMPGFMYAPFNDLDAVTALVDEETCGIMVEPIQGEGGVNIADPKFLKGLRELCDQHGLILILDEVQTGCGRTGHWFGYEEYGMEPDIMSLAKALGGGAAIGAIAARADVAEHLRPGTHASTFGGNPLACAAAIAAFETVEEENLLENVRSIGEYTLARFEEMKSKHPDLILDVRGRGVMIGVELSQPGAPVVASCLKRGLLINCTHDTVLRLLPAMNISRELMEEGLAIIEEALEEAYV